MTKYIFFVLDILATYLFADITYNADFDIVHLKRSLLGRILIGSRSPIARIVKKLKLTDFFCEKIFCYRFGRYKKIFDDYRKNKKIDAQENYVFVFVAGAAFVLPKQMLLKLSERQNVSLALLLMDSFHASSPTAVNLRDVCFEKIWKKVYTFDKNDAKEFGFEHIGLCYYSTSKFLPRNLRKKNKSDVFFIGGLKGARENLILSLFKKCESHNVKADFVLSCIDKNQWKNRNFPNNITCIKKWIPYSKVLSKAARTNCIVEILQKNQFSQSVRYFEALVFNKKLLTNNPNIFELPYYDERYMKYFKSVEDIDFEWLKKKETVNYGYNNEFSALHLTQIIEADFKEMTWGGVQL